MRRLVTVAGVALTLGCGAAKTETEAPSAEPSGPEAQCLNRAAAPRARKPDEPGRVSVSHILVRHVDSKNAKGISRSRGEACLRALEALQQLESGKGSFEDVVAKYSDERGAASRKGSLGQIQRDNVEAAFADAAFELEVKELSYVVETDAGFHVILRTE